MATPRLDLAARLAEYADRPNECWVWPGSAKPGQYIRRRVWRADGTRPMVQLHREAYLLLVGPIPHSLTLDHTCEETRCLNPRHMEPCTRSENSLRRWRRKDTRFCKRGHEFEVVGYYRKPRPDGGFSRGCIACHREWTARQKAIPGNRERNTQRMRLLRAKWKAERTA